MADAFSSVLKLRLQETGGNNDTWGTKLNSEALQYLEDKATGETAISTTGGDTTLTDAQRRCAIFKVSGVLVSNAVLIVPNTKNNWLIWNNATHGGFAVTIKTASGTGGSIATIPPDCVRQIYCDGSDGVFRTDYEDIGTLLGNLTGASTPHGTFRLPNSNLPLVSRTGLYRDIFLRYGTAYGPGDGSTTFSLPFIVAEPFAGGQTHMRL